MRMSEEDIRNALESFVEKVLKKLDEKHPFIYKKTENGVVGEFLLPKDKKIEFRFEIKDLIK